MIRPRDRASSRTPKTPMVLNPSRAATARPMDSSISNASACWPRHRAMAAVSPVSRFAVFNSGGGGGAFRTSIHAGSMRPLNLAPTPARRRNSTATSAGINTRPNNLESNCSCRTQQRLRTTEVSATTITGVATRARPANPDRDRLNRSVAGCGDLARAPESQTSFVAPGPPPAPA